MRRSEGSSSGRFAPERSAVTGRNYIESSCSGPNGTMFHRLLRPSGKGKTDMETILTILLPASFLVLLAVERLFPARPLPKISWWLAKGFLFFMIGGAINAAIPGVVAAVAGRFAPV